MVDSGLETLAISLAHAARAGDLPAHHRDPFARMLVAQAVIDGFTIPTRDPAFAAYEVPLLAACRPNLGAEVTPSGTGAANLVWWGRRGFSWGFADFAASSCVH